MKKLLLVCVALFVVAGLAVPAAQAQGPWCMKWVAFCDGIQINSIQAGKIDATWYHWDCANDTPMKGLIRPGLPNACPEDLQEGGDNPQGNDTNFIIACLSAMGCPAGDWVWEGDQIDGTIDMCQGGPGMMTCWINQLAYTFFAGPCTGAPQQLYPQISSIQARSQG